MAVADNLKPYPPAASYETWNNAKTTAPGDKLSTGLGKALSKARASYSTLKWEQLDVTRYEGVHGAIDKESKSVVALRSAKLNLRQVGTAIRHLEEARAKAKDAGKNVLISKQRKAAAKSIYAALDEPLKVLKAIHVEDFEAKVTENKGKF